MVTPSTTDENMPPLEGRMVVRLSLIGFSILFAAACVLWAGFGQNIFIDLVTFVRSCL